MPPEIGALLPADLAFPSTARGRQSLPSEPFVLFVYPRTGRPDEPEPEGWGDIPGARGCTAEACSFRDLATEYSARGYALFGLSSQDTEYQLEAAERLHLPYPLLADPAFELARALDLDTFEAAGMTLYRRQTLVGRGGRVVAAFTDIGDTATHPAEVLASLAA